MTTDPRPAEPTDEARVLLAEAAADYAAAQEHRRRAQANAAARARATRTAGDQYDCAAIKHRVTH